MKALSRKRIPVAATERRLADRWRALIEVTQALASHLEEQHVFELAVQHASRLLQAPYSRLRLVDPDGCLRCVAAEGQVRPDTLQRRLPPSSVSGAVLQQGVLNLSDALDHGSWDRALYGAQGRMRAYLGVQVRRADDVLGVLEVMRPETGAFAQDEVQLLQALANAAAVSVANARLVEERLAHARAEESSRARQAVLLAVTHDLKAPLTVILATLGLIRRPGLQVGAEPSLDDIRLVRVERAANRMVRMLDHLADVQRMEAGEPLPIDCEQADLASLLREAVAEQQALLPDASIRLVAPDERLDGWWDAGRLRRVFDNLLGNAVKYSSGKPEVTVTVSRFERNRRTWARVTVEDRGRGIPAEDLPRIFDLFTRGRNVAGHVAGTGIGLSSARTIVEQHGGRISAISQVGAGSTFTVELPTAPPSRSRRR